MRLFSLKKKQKKKQQQKKQTKKKALPSAAKASGDEQSTFLSAAEFPFASKTQKHAKLLSKSIKFFFIILENLYVF